MWFPARVRELGSVERSDFETFKEAVLATSEEVWTAGDAIKTKLAGDRPTHSIFLYNLDPDNYASTIAKRAITQEDITSDNPDGLADLARPLIDFVVEAIGGDGLVVRAQLARMQPGAKIGLHYDSSPILLSSHRLHIPILTHNKLRFLVDGERVVMKEGELYELNNQLPHEVENPRIASTRIHLIIDFLPAFINKAEIADQRLEFTVRKAKSKKGEPKPAPHTQLPKVIATSVVRGSHQSESHGGVFIIDLESDTHQQVVDWNNCDIDFSGRGWDRGLRGVCFDKDRIFIAATDEIIEFDKSFNMINRFSNRYLRHAHEMRVFGKHIYVTSTGFDSVLRFDLRKQQFDKGWSFSNNDGLMNFREFDPESITDGPQESNIFHINNVFVSKEGLFISGRSLGHLVRIKGDRIDFLDRVPPGTHNVQPFAKGILYNDSEGDQIVYSHNYDFRYFDVPRYDESELENLDLGDEKVARQAFGRGLCHYKDGLIIAGSSPSTISVHDIKTRALVKSVNLTLDVRNAIHGLEIWPF